MSKREILVYGDWQGMPTPLIMGVLTAELLRGKEVFSFSYDKDWLSSEYAQTLDPDLQLYSGPQYLNDDQKFNFGLFLDSSPDRWGRVLMQRREAALARLEKRKPNKLFETDYLLGVYDEHRMGGLRFKLDIDGPFLSDDERHASPPWTSLRQLEQISLRLEEDGVVNDPKYLEWLHMLVNPGSSLGGARPKASVVDALNQLWIAKFPSRSDKTDVGAWEMVAYELALSSGIKMSECQANRFYSDQHTFLTKRFDRTVEGKRIHYTSAMTQLGYVDGADAHEGVSYLELVEFLTSKGSNVTEDLKQLWRRIVFNICISNTDDHLRNHGFILTDTGWCLSPAFDLNPVAHSTGLKLNISDSDNALNLDLALEVHEYFRLEKTEAHEIIRQVLDAVSEWRTVADKYRISKDSQEMMATAFQITENY